ncbi:MAG: LysM domain-containing protein [Anaerolineae bacterium]
MVLRQWLILVCMVVLLGVVSVRTQAQSNDASCPALVEQALTQVGNNCGDLSRNSACYGFNKVNATFAETVTKDFFSKPAERTELSSMRRIETSPLDLGLEQWGIAVLNVQANVPNTLPGQAVTFLLIGDTELENAVEAIPSTDQASTTNNQSPMQSFYFRTRPGGIECSQTPSLLAIQSPENLKVNLTANGADIELGSLVVLQVLPDGQTMQLTTLQGNATINPGQPDEIHVPAGMTTTHCLSQPQDLGDDGESNDQQLGDCDWEPVRPATIEELEQGQPAQAILDRLGLTQTEVEPVVEILPTSTPVPTEMLPSPQPECPFGTTIIHPVSPGENLFRISLRYNTSMGAIMQANGIVNPERIFAGQNLVIPCGVDLGIPSLPNLPPDVTPDTTVVGVDCTNFQATSPLDGLDYGMNTFYWDPAAGVTGYQVNIFNIDEKGGALVASFQTGAGNTSLTADLTVQSVGYGFSFAWEVLALVDGQVVCSSQRFTVPRAPGGQPVNQAPGAPVFTASWSCLFSLTAQVNWSNAPAGTTSLNITFTPVISEPACTVASPGSSGSTSCSVFSAKTSGLVTANPSGQTAPLPAIPAC